ncbi:MAG: hypothetical protein JSR90_06525 [Proteobacteria bacterium]|nr:hypothetical protein [Pseudomonadota bacterium]
MILFRGLLLAALVAFVVALVGWLVFVPRRPLPTGPWAVGRIDVVLRDPEDGPLSLTIWYPASGQAGGSAVEGARFAARVPAPLILYSPGWGGTRTQSSSQTENLASHGFVVVGCDDISSDPATDPDKGSELDFSSDKATAETIDRGGRHALIQARRLLAVLHALETSQIPQLAGRLNLARVGALGYSAGGSAALQAALLDPRIVAVVNLDGALFGATAEQTGSNAYFLLSSDEAFPSAAELTSPDPFTRNYAKFSERDLPLNAERMNQTDNGWVLLQGARHPDLADGLFVMSRHSLFRTNRERHRLDAALRDFEVAFFDSTLLGNPAPLAALRKHPMPPARWVDPHAAALGTPG